MYNLVIVDMQPYFNSSKNPKTLSAVIEEVKKAKKARAYIVVLEFGFQNMHKYALGDDAFTYKEIRDELKGYENHYYKTKWKDDGSKEVLKAMREANSPYNHYKVCGVNTNACVLSTVCELDWQLNANSGDPKIEVLLRACNAPVKLNPKLIFKNCSSTVQLVA